MDLRASFLYGGENEKLHDNLYDRQSERLRDILHYDAQGGEDGVPSGTRRGKMLYHEDRNTVKNIHIKTFENASKTTETIDFTRQKWYNIYSAQMVFGR